MSHRLYSIKEITKLEKRRFRNEEGVFVIEGKKIIEEAIQAKAEVTQILVTGKFLKEQQEFIQRNNFTPRDLTVISDHNAQRLSDTQTPQGIFAIVKKPEFSFDDLLKESKVVVFENVRDPGNLGTMIRTADWFGVKAIMVSEEGVDPYNDKVIRSTMGSLFHLSVYTTPDLLGDLEELKSAGFSLITSRPEVKTSVEPKHLEKFALILGNESTGTSREVDNVADAVYSIPKYGQAESLNVSVSFGIMLSHLLAKTE